MEVTQTSYLLQKVAPLVMREIGPRVGPVVAEKFGIPLAKKVGLPIARRIGIPIARKTGSILFNKFGYPFLNKMLLKVNLSTPNSSLLKNADPAVSTPLESNEPSNAAAVPQPKKKKISLKEMIRPKKVKKIKSRKNQAAPAVPVPVNQPSVQTVPQPLPQVPPQIPVAPNTFEEKVQENFNPYQNYNSTLFHRRRRDPYESF